MKPLQIDAIGDHLDLGRGQKLQRPGLQAFTARDQSGRVPPDRLKDQRPEDLVVQLEPGIRPRHIGPPQGDDVGQALDAAVTQPARRETEKRVDQIVLLLPDEPAVERSGRSEPGENLAASPNVQIPLVNADPVNPDVRREFLRGQARLRGRGQDLNLEVRSLGVLPQQGQMRLAATPADRREFVIEHQNLHWDTGILEQWNVGMMGRRRASLLRHPLFHHSIIPSLSPCGPPRRG